MKHRSISIILLFIVSAMLIGIFAGCEGIGNATEAEAAESTNGMYDEYILTEEDLAELNEAFFQTLLYFDSSLSELDEATLNELRNIPNNMFSQTVEGAMSRPTEKHEGSRYYVGKYDIPYFGNRFLSSDTTGSWSMGNLASNNEYLVNDLTMNVQDIPTWKYNQGQAKELNVDFYLLNKNIADTIKNMKFLFSFAAGAYWIQTSLIGYRSPNLYRLFCPGRFLMLYAAMGIDIEFVGKVRRYTTEDAKVLFGNNTGFEPLNVMINRMSSCNIPESYKISVKFKDLTPNAFNIQAAYFTDTQTDDKSGNNINIFPKINVHREAKAVSVEALGSLINKKTGLNMLGTNDGK